MTSLQNKALGSLAILFLVTVLLLFGAAGTLHYRQGWTFLACYFAAALVMLLGIPIALGSWWGVLVVVAILPALVWRLMDEERFLATHLPGYAEYQGRVHYRLLPGIW